MGSIIILGKHQNVIEDPKFDNCFLWQQQALSYIERFLGKDSIEYQLFLKPSFPNYPDPKYDDKLKVCKHVLLTAIKQSTETIKTIGIKREYHNFLCRYSDKELVTIMIAVALAILV